MKYYKVKKEYDNKHINPYIRDNNILVENELYTEKELNKIIEKGLKHYKNYMDFFDIIEVSKKKVYFFFGARFADETTIKEMKEKEKIIKEGKRKQAVSCFYND